MEATPWQRTACYRLGVGKGTRRQRKAYRIREAAHLAAQNRILNSVPLRSRRWKGNLASLVMLALLFLLPSIAQAESVYLCCSQIRNGNQVEQLGTAVCVGRDGAKAILVTCKHNVADNPRSVWLQINRKWKRCDAVSLHPTEDLAICEIQADLKVSPIADADLPPGSQVLVEGAGPTANRTRERIAFAGVVESSDSLIGSSGDHAIPGDSGGPVFSESCVVGIISQVEMLNGQKAPPRSRREMRGAKSLFVPASKVRAWLETQYQCGPQGCPIVIRPIVRQPMIGFGLPIGPPQVIGVAEPAPRRYFPEGSRPSAPAQPSVTQGPAGPQGPPGPTGAAGRDGQDVDKEHVEAVINAWLEANVDRMQPDITALESRLSALEQRPFTMILSEDGKIIDREEYPPGAPVVLDLKRLKVGSQQ